MIASKEQAKKAEEVLAKAHRTSTLEGMRYHLSSDEYVVISDFIAAAAKRLPTQAAIDKDRKRKKIYHEGRKNAKAPQGVPS